MAEAKEVTRTGGRPKIKYKKTKLPAHLQKKKRPAQSRAMKVLYKNPVEKARILMRLDRAREIRKAALDGTPPRLGVPAGWTREQAEMQRVYDGIKADLLIDRMKAEGMIPETPTSDFEVIFVEVAGNRTELRVPKTEAAMAEAALREAMIGAMSPLTHANNRVPFIRTVLEWTKKKPATDINQNVTSEDWLEAALKDNDGYRAGEAGAT